MTPRPPRHVDWRASADLLQEWRARDRSLAKSLYDTSSNEESEAAIQRNELREDTLATLIDRLTRFEASEDKPEQERTALMLKFRALIYLQPHICADLVKPLMRAAPDSATTAIIAGTLSNVGHGEAQSALVSTIRGSMQDLRTLLTLIPALGMVSTPTSEAEECLFQMALDSSRCEVAYTAQLSLGVMARNLRGKSPARAAALVNKLISIDAGACPAAMKQRLLMLGNTGSSIALPFIRRQVTASEPQVRSAAVLSLRWIDSNDAGSMMAQALVHDQDSSVRLAAAIGLAYRNIDALSLRAQRSALFEDKAVEVRLAVLSNLWNARSAFAEASEWVKTVARSDESKDVREAASNLLTRPK